jgi:predicted phage terminase large subunit-like protein
MNSLTAYSGDEDFRRKVKLEKVRRRLASSPEAFADFIDVPGRPVAEDDEESDDFAPAESLLADHHRLILREMERVSQTRHGRLMIFAPPGSAKSSYASVVFPSHFLGRKPERRLILASYGDSLSRKMGRRTRSIIKQRKYQSVFKCGLTAESSAAHEFKLTNGSEYMAGGILSGITGNRAHGIVIDDPVKGREDANSDAISQKTWDAYNDDLKTRLIPGGWIVLIQTRWSEKDLAGRILPDDWKGESGDILCKDGQTWRVLCLQAKCETDTDPLGRKRGEYLWPQWFDRDHWKQFEGHPVTWASLYQQIPSPLDGGFFKPLQLVPVDALPAGPIQWVRGWDFGASSDGDYTVGGKLGKLGDGRFVIADIERGKWETDERDTVIRNVVAGDGQAVAQDMPQDPGQAGKSLAVYLARQLAGYRVSFSTESGDKMTRAEPMASQINAGNVLMLKGSWNDALKTELALFPNGKNDDQVDGLARAFNRLVAGKKGQGLLDMMNNERAAEQSA